MRVYITMHIVPYEGSEVMAAYLFKEDADKHANRIEQRNESEFAEVVEVWVKSHFDGKDRFGEKVVAR